MQARQIVGSALTSSSEYSVSVNSRGVHVNNLAKAHQAAIFYLNQLA